MAVFKDSAELYDIFGSLLSRLRDEPEVAAQAQQSKLVIRWQYTDPQAEITIDCTKKPVYFSLGAYPAEPDIEMCMSADTAHRFWLGKLDLIAALTQGSITATGSLPAILKLLPVIKPAFDIYPTILREHGRADLLDE